MIAPTLISNLDEIVKKMIFKSEGKIEQPRNIGADHTVTYGYGYTFIRKSTIKGKDVWSIYRYLDDDLFEIGIILNEEEQNLLKNIVVGLNNGGDLKKTADPLIVKFIEDKTLGSGMKN